MTEQARETPEPLTPVVAFLDKYGLANTSGERHAARKEALTLARAALRAATPDPAYDFAWLIESGQPPRWYGSYATGRDPWTTDATLAIRFPDRAGAEAFIVSQGIDGTAVEHGFLRAATPDPAEPEHERNRARNRATEDASGGFREIIGCGCTDCVALRANDPDPAEPGLREALQGAVDAWTAEYGPDDNAPWLTKALRALSDTTEGQS
jgi:hypothetical protein